MSHLAHVAPRLLAIPLWMVIAVTVLSPATPAVAKVVMVTVLATTLWSPAEGLLLAVGLAPLGAILAAVFGLSPFRLSEAIIVSFIAAWLAGPTSAAGDGPRMPRYASTAAWLFGAVVVGSVVGLSWQVASAGDLQPALDPVATRYFQAVDRLGIVEGAKLLEGFALAAATVILFRRRPALAVELPTTLAATGAAAATLSVLVWLGIGPAETVRQLGRLGYRVSGHVRDVNAAGSYFAMVLCLTLGMAGRARRRERVAWCAAAALNGIGLWFSESRTAFAAAGTVIAVAGVWYVVARLRPAVRAAVIASILFVALGVGAYRVYQVSFGLDYRVQFYATSLRMIQARPLVGVGVGQYYPTSALFLSPQLAWNYGFENAHNNLLQIGAELGLAGLGLFVVCIGGGLAYAARALGVNRRDPRLLGITSGVAAFVGTWVASHPLLVSEVAFPFWVQFGLMSALAGSTLLNASVGSDPSPATSRRPRSSSYAGAIAVAVCSLLMAPVSAWREPLDPPDSREVDGFYEWETASDGVRFRWTERFASLFVPADVTRVEIPVRLGASGRVRMEVDVVTAGDFRSRTAVGDAWTILDVTLRDARPPTRFKRIDLRMDRTWQPAIYLPGSADMRQVGVQVGECKLFRER